MFKSKLFIFLVFCVTLLSKETNGQIVLNGVVSDSDSDPVQGVEVQLIDQLDTTKIFQDTTNQNGEYSIGIISSVDEQNSQQPNSYKLYQNYPNPFNPSTVIQYEIPQHTHVKIEIYNILGQKIKTLVDEFQANLVSRVVWDATNDKGLGVSSGIYIYSLIVDGHRINKKMLLIDGHTDNSNYKPSSPPNYSTSKPIRTEKIVSTSYILKVTSENIQTFKEELQLTGNLVRNITVIRTINKNAVFIDTANTQLTVTSVDTTSYDIPVFNLQIDGDVPDLKAGSVIVDTTGMGMIYVVIDDLKLKKGLGIITAIQGSLDFLLKNTELMVATPQNRTKISTEEIKNKLPMVNNEIYGRVNDKEYHLNFNEDKLEVEISFLDENIWEDPQGNFSISITEGSLYFKPAVDYHTIYSNRDIALSLITPTLSIGALRYLRLITYSDMDLDIKLNFHAEGAYDILDKNIKIVSYLHPIPIGPVVLTMEISLNLNFDVGIDAAMDITTGYNVKNNIVVGFELPDGPSLKPVYYKEFNKIEENILSPQLEAQLSFIERLEIIPEVEIYLYGILGANGEIIPYQEFVFNSHLFNDLVDWDCEFALGLDGKISLDLSAFHFDEATIELVSKYFPGPRAVLYSAPHLEIVSGNDLVGVIGERLAEPFRVRAVDNDRNLCVLPVNVYWDVTQGGGQLDAGNSYYTFSDEYAENYYTLGNSAGENLVSSYLKKADGTVHDDTIFTARAEETEPDSGTVTDIDGNVYRTVQIGTQVWMAENLKVTHYRNGDAIPNVTAGTAWAGLSSGSWCSYNNDAGNTETYGLLYNWYALNDSRIIAPYGWHIATDAEWRTLLEYIGGSYVAGGKLKESGIDNWTSPNTGATNEFGFSALPAGERNPDSGNFSDLYYDGYFWSATERDDNRAWYRALNHNQADVSLHGNSKQYGLSVRCVRD